MRMWGWPLVGALLCVGGVARAERTPFRFVYERAPGAEACPDEARLREEIDHRLGGTAFDTGARATLICRVEPSGGGLRAVITIVDASGPGRERVLDSPRSDCADLAEAMELTLALAIDPSGSLGTDGDGGGDLDPTPDAPVHELGAVSESRPTPISSVVGVSPATRAPRRFVLGAALSADVGLGPGPGVGAAVGGGWRGARGTLSVELGATFSSTDAVAGGSVRADLYVARLVPCALVGRLAVCGLLGAGVLRGHGEGFPGARTGSAFWAGAGARLAWPLSARPGFALGLHAEITTPVVGAELVVSGREVWHSPPVAGALRLGITFE